MQLISGHRLSASATRRAHRRESLDRLEQKIKRMNLLQRELFQLSNDVAEEIAAIRKIDEELEELVA